MAKVFSALATSADGFITGPDPGPEQPLGRGGGQLFDWYFNGGVPSAQFSGFRLSAPSAAVFDAAAERIGAVIAGRKTYDDSNGWGGGGPHPAAPLFVLSHRAAPPGATGQTFIATGLADAVAAAARAAAGKDVALMGASLVVGALREGLLDEMIVHQVPVLLGGGVALFGGAPHGVQLRSLGVVAAPGVTHLHYAVVR